MPPAVITITITLQLTTTHPVAYIFPPHDLGPASYRPPQDAHDPWLLTTFIIWCCNKNTTHGLWDARDSSCRSICIKCLRDTHLPFVLRRMFGDRHVLQKGSQTSFWEQLMFLTEKMLLHPSSLVQLISLHLFSFSHYFTSHRGWEAETHALHAGTYSPQPSLTTNRMPFSPF